MLQVYEENPLSCECCIHLGINVLFPVTNIPAHLLETDTLLWWDGLRDSMTLMGYANGSLTPGRFNFAGQAIKKES